MAKQVSKHEPKKSHSKSGNTQKKAASKTQAKRKGGRGGSPNDPVGPGGSPNDPV